MARRTGRGRSVARVQASAPRITGAAVNLVSDIDRVKARIAKLAKRLDVAVPNLAADTPASASVSGAIAGASSSVGAIHELLSHIEQAV